MKAAGNVGKKKLFQKKELVFSIILASWICIVNIVLLIFGVKNTWPIFFTTIFFYLQGADEKKVKQIFCGGLFGIFMAWVFVESSSFLAPMVGSLLAAIIPVVLIIFAIIVLGPLAPLLFNTEAFTILTVCTISAELVKANMVQYAVNFIVGGGILLAGAIAISRGVEKVFIPEPDARPDL